MTHDDLVRRAVAWLKKPASKKLDDNFSYWYKSGCGVVVPELVSYAPENPDAIGWSGHASYLVECKVSRSDFAADQYKGHRSNGAGSYRLFLCEPGVIPPDRLPAGWGLLHCHPQKITIEVAPSFNTERNMSSELSMMYSLLRRVEVRGELTRCLSPKWGGDSKPAVMPLTLQQPGDTCP